MPKLYTAFVRPEIDDFNPGGGEILVETAGYIPAEKQIIDMINAGIRLGTYREQFDYNSIEEIDINNVEVDPTREADFDQGDAILLMNSIKPVVKDKIVNKKEKDVEDEEDNEDLEVK